MTQDDLEFLPQGIDYLGFLNAQLRDLRGYRTLANELIQNADDTPGATSISFDVRDDRLIVQNDGVFSDCGHVRNRACPWQSDPSMHFVSCDLHRFRIVASAGKRSQAETTGAFGVGFISVYQITDRPQLVTRGHHWQVRPEESEERRIRVLSVEAQLDATEFRLPWAFDQSQVREALGVEPVPTNVRELVLDELKGWIPTAILFLRRLRRIELRSNGESFQVVRVQRDPEDGPGQTLIKEDGKPSQIWQILEGGFEQEATQVRRLSGGRIEDKRKAKVSLAIPLTEIEVEGRFFATLPTDHKIGLPFHINSDFFPSSDRKRILLDQDYQGNWNRLAICKSATVLGHALLPLRESMAPAGLWALLLSVWSVHQQLKRQDDPFAVLKGFWEEAARVVRSSPLVWCYGESYKAPQEVFLPRGFREGEEIFPVYRDLGVSIVHPDLAASRNLLLEVKVPVISAPELARAMRRAGLDKPFPFGEAPAWLQAKENRDLLAQEIDALLRQVGGRDRQEAARRDLAACTLAHTSDNYLAPPAGVRKADTPTQALFSRCAGPIRFLSAENADGIEGLCAEFSVADAVRGINDTRKEEAESLWAEDAAWPVRLAQWFYERRSTLLSDPRIKAALRGLPVWPSGKHLRPLHQLSVPGDFKDPLSLASIVNADMVEACGEFLVRDLGALELSILVYATHHIPRAFESQEEVPHHVRRRLVRVLAENIGKLRDHQGARKALAGCSLVECTDGEFRSAEDVYFDTELVRKLLGEQVARARIPEKDGQALEDLLGWLGVSYRPHGVDIVSRVKKLVLEPMTPQLRLTIQEMIGQLGREWAKFADSSDDLQELKTLKWLPDTEGKEWQPPKAVYATFRQYLFSTQASFIDLPRAQERLSADFLSFLGVKAEPSLIQIVNHLISSAQRQVPINVEVYAELTRNADAPEIAKLRGEKCLHLKEFGYVSPTMVFWSSHPFGKYRIHLGQDWRVYTPFLTRVGVRDAPEPSDAAAVLFQIAEEFGPFHRILEEDSYNVVLRCWQLLSESLDQGHSCGDVIKNLRERKVIPDGRRILNKPDRIFFEDRPRLVEKFGDHLKDNVIARPQGGWPAMEQAGVRLLSEVIRIDLVECEDEQRDEEVDALLRSRRPLISRVLVGAGTDRLQSILLERLQVFRTSRLRIKYWIDGFGLNMPTPIEEVQAYLSRENDRLYIRRSSPPPWAAISRELSYALVSTDEPGRLAAGIKEVLEAGSDEEAASVLDDLGFAPLMVTTDLNQPEGPTGAVGGDKRAEAKDAIDDNASDEGAAAGGNGTGPRDGTEDGGGREKQSGRKGGNAPTGRTKGKRTEILRSYVRWEREGVGGAISPSQTEEEEGVASVGVSKVLEYEKRESRFPTRKPHNYPGYDIESRNAEGEIVRYIEVKSLSGEWTNVGAGMSKEQFGTAWIEEGKFWLYVVERASSTDAKLFAFKNPAHRVVDFRFDDGWRECADEQAILKRRSILDLKSDDQGSAPEENEEVEL